MALFLLIKLSLVMFSVKETAQHTQGVETMLIQCESNVASGGPMLNQHCVNVLSLVGEPSKANN